jgi:hypothetical protein
LEFARVWSYRELLRRVAITRKDGVSAQKSRYRLELFCTLGVALVALGWTLTTGEGVVSVAVAWFLWAIPLLFGVHLFWRWSGDLRWRPQIRTVLSVVAIGTFVVLAATSIRAARSRTLIYFIPGFEKDAKTRNYAAQFVGYNRLRNVDVKVSDETAFDQARLTNDPALLKQYSRIPFLRGEEIDPIHKGVVVWLPYQPFDLDHDRLEFEIEADGLGYIEHLEQFQEGADALPSYYMTLKNRWTNTMLLRCISDARYAAHDRTKINLPLCCGDIYPTEGAYAACAPMYVKVELAIKARWRQIHHRIFD